MMDASDKKRIDEYDNDMKKIEVCRSSDGCSEKKML